MISAGYRQRHGPPRAFGLCEVAGLDDFVGFARDDELAGTIEIRQDDACLRAAFARRALVQIQDGCHAAFGGVASFLHESATLTDHSQSILETDHPGGGQRGELAEGKTGWRSEEHPA